MEFRCPDGARRRGPPADCWPERFEDVAPGVLVLPRGRHVGFQSWLERDALMALDADPDVVAVASPADVAVLDYRVGTTAAARARLLRATH